MRVFLLFLMLTLGLSSYSAAAHTFCKEKNPLVLMPETADQSVALSDCIGHKSYQSTHKASGHEKSAKGGCVHCAHCFALHAIDSSGGAGHFPPQLQNLHPTPANEPVQGFVFPLLRPPKLCV
jgi:hypothetical protein